MNGWGLVLSAVVTLLGGGGLYKLVEVLVRRAPARAEAAAQVNKMTVEWAAILQKDAEAAHRKLREFNEDADRMRATHQDALDRMARQVSQLTTQAERCTARLRYWRREILSPHATLDALRHMVNAASEPGDNGHNPKE